MAKQYKGERRFIDTRDADSYIHVQVPSRWESSFTVRIADCHRVVSLYFSTEDAKAIRRSQAKLKRVMDALQRMGAELERLALLENEKKKGG